MWDFLKQVDWNIVGPILATLITGMTSATGLLGGALWRICTFLGAKITSIVDRHNGVMDTMMKESPKVNETLCALKETQIQQCKQLDQHSEILVEIKDILKKSNPDMGGKS